MHGKAKRELTLCFGSDDPIQAVNEFVNVTELTSEEIAAIGGLLSAYHNSWSEEIIKRATIIRNELNIVFSQSKKT